MSGQNKSAFTGEMTEGDVTIFKTSVDLERMFCEEGIFIENQYGRDLAFQGIRVGWTFLRRH